MAGVKIGDAVVVHLKRIAGVKTGGAVVVPL